MRPGRLAVFLLFFLHVIEIIFLTGKEHIPALHKAHIPFSRCIALHTRPPFFHRFLFAACGSFPLIAVFASAAPAPVVPVPSADIPHGQDRYVVVFHEAVDVERRLDVHDRMKKTRFAVTEPDGPDPGRQ